MSDDNWARGLLTAGIALGLAAAAAAQAGTTTLESADSSGVQGNKESRSPAISADGRWVAFESLASNLVPGDTNGVRDVFLRDLTTGQTTRVSVTPFGGEGDGESGQPAISADGHFVAFASYASNLLPGDTNGTWDVFLRDTWQGTSVRVSLSSTGAQASGGSAGPRVSGDGRYVTFVSNAADLVSGDTNGVTDTFLRDVQLGTTTRVSVDSLGIEADQPSDFGDVSDDGTRVAFMSRATNLVPGDTNGAWDVFLHDLTSGLTTRVSVSSTGTQGDSHSRYPSLSVDGRRVAFSSFSHSLVAGDQNGASDVFLHDTLTGQTTLESRSTGGVQGNGGSEFPSLSSDGLQVAFMSGASNLVAGDTNGATDVFVRDVAGASTTRESLSSAGVEGNNVSFFPTLTADAGSVAFMSLATNLVPGDNNGTWDVFLRERDLSGGVTTYCTASTTSIPGCQAAIAGTGTPSLSNPTGFVISSGNIPGNVFSIAYFGKNGPAAIPFGTQGGYLCVATPIFRAAAKTSGGTSGTCTGQVQYTLQDLIDSHAALAVQGTITHVAIWFRDPPSPDTFALSDGLRFTVLP